MTSTDLPVLRAFGANESVEVRSDAHLAMNMTMDAGRPSDAMRSAVRAWKGRQS